MGMRKIFIALACVAVGWGMGCSSGRQAANEPTVDSGQLSAVHAPVVIYKTSHDYSRNVPVGLSEDGSRIVSYPAVSDVRVGGKYPYPTPLAEGYLLDNRGIGRNVAFLSYTYEEYAALSATPSATELLEKVIDKHPLTEYHVCGSRYQYKDLVNELNEQIRKKRFK